MKALRASTALALVSALAGSATAAAQRVSDAQVERRVASDPAAVAATLGDAPVWLAWTVPGTEDAARLCCFDNWTERRCRLDARDHGWGSSSDWPPEASGDSTLVVLVEVAGGRPLRLRAVGGSCPIVGGGRRLVALDGVEARPSLDLLERFVDDPRAPRAVSESALAAVGHHADGVPELLRLLREASRPKVRREALFWLAQSNDPRALAGIESLLAR